MLDEAGVRLDVSVDWQEVALIVREAYLHVAPRGSPPGSTGIEPQAGV